jgi:TetR/AcrR family transcriptional regulator
MDDAKHSEQEVISGADRPPDAAPGPDTEAPATSIRLLDAAEEVFGEQGFAGATTSAIAERAGVTKALVHYYYRNKETLHRAVMERYDQRVSELVLEDLDMHEPTAAVANAMRRYCGFLAQNRNYVRLCLYNALEETCQVTKTQMFRKLIDETTAALKKGMELGTFRSVDPLQLLLAIEALCSYFFEHEKEIRELWGEENFDRERMVKEHTEHVVRMVMWAICEKNADIGQCGPGGSA